MRSDEFESLSIQSLTSLATSINRLNGKATPGHLEGMLNIVTKRQQSESDPKAQSALQTLQTTITEKTYNLFPEERGFFRKIRDAAEAGRKTGWAAGWRAYCGNAA
jgi:hypothetical protein